MQNLKDSLLDRLFAAYDSIFYLTICLLIIDAISLLQESLMFFFYAFASCNLSFNLRISLSFWEYLRFKSPLTLYPDSATIFSIYSNYFKEYIILGTLF